MGDNKAVNTRGWQDRIVTLIDMDCFYVQVEQREAPEWRGKPCAVVQYNDWKGGGIIAVGYEARARGVSRRNMRGDDARSVCPDIKLFSVPEVRGKADLTKYREAGAEVISVLCQFEGCVVERASIDEAYVDLTDRVHQLMSSTTTPPVTDVDLPHTFIVGADDSDVKLNDRDKSMKEWLEFINSPDCLDSHNERRLALAAQIVERMRQAVKDQTGFNCSAGISHNKVLSKLACGLHKPQKQTILALTSVPELFAKLPIQKVRHFGGKLGRSLIEEFDLEFIGDIVKLSNHELCSQYGDKTGSFIYNLCRGNDPETVSSRQLPKSVGCSKNFRGKLLITNYEKAQYWLKQLSSEMEERLIKDRDQNNRIAKSLSMSVRFSDWTSVSRAIPLSKYSQLAIEKAAMTALTKLCGDVTTLNPSIGCLGLSAGKFEDIEGKSLSHFFSSSKNVDPFDQITPASSNINPMTSTSNNAANIKLSSEVAKKVNNQSDLKWFATSKQSVDPFDTIGDDDRVCRPEAAEVDYSNVKPCPIPPSSMNQSSLTWFATSTAVDPFEPLHKGATDNKNTQLEQLVKPGTSKGQASISQFLSNKNKYEPFESFNGSGKDVQKNSCSFNDKGIKRFLQSSADHKNRKAINLYEPDTIDTDILDIDSDYDSSDTEILPTNDNHNEDNEPSMGRQTTCNTVHHGHLTQSADAPQKYSQKSRQPGVKANTNTDLQSKTTPVKTSAILDDIISIWEVDSMPPHGFRTRKKSEQDMADADEESVSYFDAIELEERLYQKSQNAEKSQHDGLLSYANALPEQDSTYRLQSLENTPPTTRRSIDTRKRSIEDSPTCHQKIKYEKNNSHDHETQSDSDDEISVVWESKSPPVNPQYTSGPTNSSVRNPADVENPRRQAKRKTITDYFKAK